jgi:hypothetical protein
MRALPIYVCIYRKGKRYNELNYDPKSIISLQRDTKHTSSNNHPMMGWCEVGMMKVLVLSLVAGAVAAVRPSKLLPAAVPAVYVFGDSTLDVGNNNYLPGKDVPRADKPYYGIDLPGSGKPTGRFSNGYNTADFVGEHINMHATRTTKNYMHVLYMI